MRNVAVIVAAAMLPVAGAHADQHMPAQDPPVAATTVNDAAALARLRGNSGITLQWISWDYRGVVSVSDRGDVVHINGIQRERGGDAYVLIDGDVEEIGADYFIFNGRIAIANAPDAGRYCERTGRSRFAITQNRRYWRLRQFEWCDRLTDYIDIYF